MARNMMLSRQGKGYNTEQSVTRNRIRNTQLQGIEYGTVSDKEFQNCAGSDTDTRTASDNEYGTKQSVSES